MHRQFFPIEVDLILWDVVVSADIGLRTTLHVAHTLRNLGSHLVGLGEVETVNLDIHGGVTTHRALLSTRQYGELLDLAVFSQVLTHQLTNLRQATFTIPHADQADVELDDV